MRLGSPIVFQRVRFAGMIVHASKDQAIDLRILPLNDLIPHEQTIPSLLDSVVRDLERTGLQRDPIIVDEKTYLVLDGMHRRVALEALGASFALCSVFDYLEDSILLQRWLRYFIAPDPEFIEKIIRLFDLERVESVRVGMDLVDTKKSPIALLSSRQSYASKDDYDLLSIYRRLSDFDNLANQRKIAVEFHSDAEGATMFLSESVFVLYPVPFSKQDIIEAGEKHQMFPYKTTRHIVPIRPMGLYFPLDLLKQGSLETCNRKLEDIIGESRIEVIDANSWYEGRRYSEPLAIFKRNL